jgi:hypothetical protein
MVLSPGGTYKFSYFGERSAVETARARLEADAFPAELAGGLFLAAPDLVGAPPDGKDYIEFMLYNKAPTRDVMLTKHHICLEVEDVAKARGHSSEPHPPRRLQATRCDEDRRER